MPNMNDHIKSLCPFFLTVLMLLFVSPASGLDKKSSHAKNGMVVSTSELASIVGRDVLARGGNAIDASVATAFALAVTWPSAGNIGGGGFLIYHSAKGKVTAIDFREKAPLAATEKMFLASDGTISDNSNHEGLLSVGVPGTVAGLFKAHTHYGNLPWPSCWNRLCNWPARGLKRQRGFIEVLPPPRHPSACVETLQPRENSFRMANCLTAPVIYGDNRIWPRRSSGFSSMATMAFTEVKRLNSSPRP